MIRLAGAKPLTIDSDSVHLTFITVGIIKRTMPYRTVVPKRHRAILPVESADELRCLHVLEQVLAECLLRVG